MKRRILMKPVIKSYAVLLGLVLGLALFFASPGPAHAQIQISRSISVQENVPDMGDLVNQYTWSQSGFVIDSVKVNLIFSSPVSRSYAFSKFNINFSTAFNTNKITISAAIN